MSPNTRLLITGGLLLVALAIWFFSFGPYQERVEELIATPTPTPTAVTPAP